MLKSILTNQNSGDHLLTENSIHFNESKDLHRDLPELSLEWPALSVGQWRELLSRAPKANWMHSWPYARASHLRDFKHTRFAILKRGRQSIGCMALQEIRLGPVQVINLNRGPLWFSENVSLHDWSAFAQSFRKTFPRRWLLRLRWMPEWTHSPAGLALLTEAGFLKTEQTYHTSWLDLRNTQEELSRNLHPKWRNRLKQSRASNLKVTIDWQGNELLHFLRCYEKHKAAKAYLGPSAEFFRQEFLAAKPFKEACLLWAWQDARPIAGIFVARHGRSASYRMGWNSLEGRSSKAHYNLLWCAIDELRILGVDYFDLGGLLPREAPELTQFKERMGGDSIELLGIFR